MRNHLEALVIGAEGLLLHKTRSFLTMLGIIFGVAAVVAMMAIGNGAREETLRQIEAYGANTLYVRARELRGEALREAREQGMVGLSREDGERLRQIASFVTSVAPQALIPEKVSYRERSPPSQVVAVTREYFELTRLVFLAGRPFTDTDDRSFNRVAVLGSKVAHQLFLNEDPVGRSIRIADKRFRVIGITTSATGETAGGKGGARIKTRDVEADVYVPLSVGLGAFPRIKRQGDSSEDPQYHRVGEMILAIEDPARLREARDVVASVLKRLHHDVEDFELIVPLEILEQSRRTQEIFNLVMALIAGLSLLVGGIGIMNIMVANVSERTREIGIRRAVGATRKDIELQFLWEAILISLTGGLLGIALGMGLSWTVSWTLGWETITTLGSVLVAFGVSTLVGIVFGSYPAQVAARLNPIEALRHE